MAEDTTDKRLVELEIKVTYQEDTIDKLNQVIIRQQDQIVQLERRVAALEDRPWAGSGYDPDGTEEPPPHY